MPSNQKAFGCKWVFRVKYSNDSFIKRYKARLIVQGFSQVYRIDKTETFIPMIRHESLKILLAIVKMLGMILLQINVIEVYLKNVFS